MNRLTAFLMGSILLLSCGGTPPASAQQTKAARVTAHFAGGCFWCMEPPFEKTKGVIAVISGYTGGATNGPSYEQVSAGGTGHYESVEVVYDPRQVTYAQLLEIFWRNVDPHDASGQFCDKGTQYRAAIFVANPDERRLAERSKQKAQAKLKQPVVTEILPASKFYPAEEYHQDYYKKNPVRYKFYRFNCGRDHRLGEVWGQ
jgi:peptide-methionine (S)-S-oxide reductase